MEQVAKVNVPPIKDGTLRFCVNYCRLNVVAKRGAYPLLRTEKCIDTVGKATAFSILDACSEYWQIEIEKADRNITMFSSNDGLYSSIRILFRLRNAPGTIRGTIGDIFSTVGWEYAVVCLDDIMVFFQYP